uniref:Ig-like domain-containing protein n=1 Tax=Anopheles merus TaxID=30066 RepID=A0A182V5J7_ANOME
MLILRWSVISTSSTITFNESLPVSFASHITAGIVQCQASNADGTAIAHSKIFKHQQRKMMSLQILHPPDTIYQGDSIIVQCSADRHIFTNSFTFRTEDEQRSIAVHDVPDAEHSFNWVANFTISNVTITGDYGVECEAMHHNGTLSSQRLSLKIVRPYLTVRERLIRVVARRDPEPLLLSCNAAGRPMPQYRWYRNGELLPNTNFMLVVTSSVQDEYACYTWNRAGEEWIRWDIVHREEADEHANEQKAIGGSPAGRRASVSYSLDVRATGLHFVPGTLGLRRRRREDVLPWA